MKGTRLTLSGIMCLALILIALPVLSGCRQSEPVYVKPTGEPVNLVNNSAARDHPWQEVVEFLERDTTDEERYTPERGSAYFAEILHNRAEYYGFKTAFVVAGFENGESYYLNAFNTVDYGLVYVDCTGRGAWDRAAPPDIVLDYQIPKEYEDEFHAFQMCYCSYPLGSIAFKLPLQHTCWDKVVFLEQGRKLGFVSADCELLQFDYEWYMKTHAAVEEGDLLWEALHNLVDEHEEKFEIWFVKKGWIVPQVYKHFSAEELLSIAQERKSILEEREDIKGLGETAKVLELNIPYYWQESESPVAYVEIHW